jgi:hypothetical protein
LSLKNSCFRMLLPLVLPRGIKDGEFVLCRDCVDYSAF